MTLHLSARQTLLGRSRLVTRLYLTHTADDKIPSPQFVKKRPLMHENEAHNSSHISTGKVLKPTTLDKNRHTRRKRIKQRCWTAIALMRNGQDRQPRIKKSHEAGEARSPRGREPLAMTSA